MDVDVVFSLFYPITNNGPVVVVFLPMLDHQNTQSSNMVNALQNPRTESTIVEKRYSLSKIGTICKLVTISNKLAQLLMLQWR